MCGIAGWVDFNRDIKYETETMRKMGTQLTPRGPDEAGIYTQPHCCLAHRRLIVIDPENGKQPMSRDGCTICYNGELYNTYELRKELEKNFEFETHSDTEVVLKSYVLWGEECVNRFNGIFAFAVYDEEKHRVFLARDRIGVKPLFYYQGKNKLIFASELPALLEHPDVPPSL